MNPCFKKWKT